MSKRITVPDDYIAIILHHVVASDLRSLMKAFRSKTLLRRLDLPSARSVAGDVLLALIEGED